MVKRWVNEHLPLLVLLSLALLLRLIGIHYGLPSTLQPDEPHHINIAVHFGDILLYLKQKTI